ncbi:hypothetical protein SAMN05443999_11163 [Roseovarius azorensis]|uniref:Uncharacterized protein n=1 Tax=Roseovarius azorensis TaxID=1287727 RepID=A0A1H7UYA3_9RHOB|nr:hypothetical protein SAMN05443999_11163 [Roseovarius azorensis]
MPIRGRGPIPAVILCRFPLRFAGMWGVQDKSSTLNLRLGRLHISKSIQNGSELRGGAWSGRDKSFSQTRKGPDMNLSSMLADRHASDRPVRVGLVGAGKFGSMILVRSGGEVKFGIPFLEPDAPRPR